MPVDATRDLAGVLAARAAVLRDVVHETRPDVLVVEHFPISRRSHRDEIMGAIEAAGPARIVASVRDVVLPSSSDTPPEDELVTTLDTHFDCLLVHGDPQVTRIDEQVTWARNLTIPIVYTGYVSAAAPRPSPEAEALRPFVLLSGGGGNETADLALPCIEGWSDPRTLVVFAGPLASDGLLAELEGRAAGRRVMVQRSTGDLASWMAAADLSISRAGYNTCVDVLSARTRAVLVPSAKMSDQRLRATRLAALGLATMLAPEDLTPARLREAMAAPSPAPAVTLALDGAARSAAAIEGLI
jgi:predicted glycosyltransferase